MRVRTRDEMIRVSETLAGKGKCEDSSGARLTA